MADKTSTVTSASGPDGADAQLESYIDKLEPKNQTLFRSLRAALRKRFPTANELAYDYGFALVISYAPAEHGIDAPLAIRASTTGVSLYLNQGPKLPDPKRLLRGSAKLTRFIEIDSAGQLSDPDVDALIAAAITHATVPLPATGKGRLIIKSDSAKKSSRKNSSAKNSSAKNSSAKQSSAKKASGKQSSGKKSPGKQSSSKKASGKESSGKKRSVLQPQSKKSNA